MLTIPKNPNTLKHFYKEGNTFLRRPKVWYEPDHLGNNNLLIMTTYGLTKELDNPDCDVRYKEYKNPYLFQVVPELLFSQYGSGYHWYMFI